MKFSRLLFRILLQNGTIVKTFPCRQSQTELEPTRSKGPRSMLPPNVRQKTTMLTLNLPRESMAHGRVVVSPLTPVTLLNSESNSGSTLSAAHIYTVSQKKII